MSAIRPAHPEDTPDIAAIYTEGILGRRATFRAEPAGPDDVRPWLESRGPLLVAEADGRVVAWAKVDEYSDFPAYRDVGEFAIYVAERAQGRGLGRELLEALCAEAARDGRHKLVGKLFADNEPSRALCRACGFRDVGVHHRHGRLDGEWRDVLVVERLLDPAGEER